MHDQGQLRTGNCMMTHPAVVVNPLVIAAVVCRAGWRRAGGAAHVWLVGNVGRGAEVASSARGLQGKAR